MFYKMSTYILIASIAIISGCSDTDSVQEKHKPRLVRTMVIGMNSTDNYLEFPGEVSAAQSADLGFRVNGKLSKMNVREGQQVTKNTVLAVLDNTDYVIQLQSRQADYDQANADYVRGEQLVSKDLIARADFDKLKAKRESALANLKTAQQNMNYTELKAPFDGVIAKQHVENFEDVGIMQPIYTLQDLSTLNIKLALPETIMIQRQEGKEARIRAIFDSIPDREFPLQIDSVSTEADPGSKTFEVTFSMAHVKDVNILPGMSVTVRGTPADAEVNNNIIVPAHAVIADSLGKAVYIVEELNNNQGLVARRTVTTGDLGDSGIVILTGLNEGDRVVTAGMSRVSAGLKVRISEEWTE